jgi:hypothetical protein
VGWGRRDREEEGDEADEAAAALAGLPLRFMDTVAQYIVVV